ncbi:MAG: MoxR family ATPase [Planctomycetota bacterium]|nr:MoxR family ATPase [Planctomycetota bacterium]
MSDGREELAVLDELAPRYAGLVESLRSVVIGQHDVIEQLVVGVFCEGHALIVGVPGLAKTLLVRSVAAALDLDFRRIQFTPDMMPGDVLGSELLTTDAATGERSMRFAAGPVFGNLILADEINRTPPKTQAALLEAMAERQVTVSGRTMRLPEPFIVIATQNPIEQEGTYPLPEAQLDRFMLGLRMTYPKPAEERRIVAAGDEIAARSRAVKPVFSGAELVRLRGLIGRIPLAEHVVEHAVALVRATRPQDETCPADLARFIEWGAGPRAGQALVLGSRCLAALEGEPSPTLQHVQRLAPAVLRHRVVLNYAAAAEGISADDVVERLVREVPVPRYR